MDSLVRKIDDLGRIVLPKELRKKFDMQEKDALSITPVADGILLKKYIPSCTFCGASENLKYLDEKAICSGCMDKLK